MSTSSRRTSVEAAEANWFEHMQELYAEADRLVNDPFTLTDSDALDRLEEVEEAIREGEGNR